MLGYEILTPLMILFLTYFCVGGSFQRIDLAVVNYDSFCNSSSYEIPTCPSLSQSFHLGKDVSCHIINYLNSEPFDCFGFENLEKALNRVKFGKTKAMVVFEKGFARAFSKRLEATLDISSHIQSQMLHLSEIKMRLDQINIYMVHTIRHGVMKKVFNFMQHYASFCEMDEFVTDSIGLHFVDMNGQEIVSNFTLSTLAGIVPVVHFLMSLSLTMRIIFNEKHTGIQNREMACGVSIVINWFAAVIAMFFFVTPQVLFSISFLSFVYKKTTATVNIFMVVLLHIQGVRGLSTGIALAMLSQTMEQCIYMGLTVMGISLTFSGLFGPATSMPLMFHYLLFLSPSYIASKVSNSLLNGVSLEHVNNLWLSIFIPIVWIVMAFGLALFASKVRKMRTWK